jgi:hypothetical protein
MKTELLKLVEHHLQFSLYFTTTISGESILASKNDFQYKIIPFLVTDSISVQDLACLGNVVLAFVSHDSTIVYYKIRNDLSFDFEPF